MADRTGRRQSTLRKGRSAEGPHQPFRRSCPAFGLLKNDRPISDAQSVTNRNRLPRTSCLAAAGCLRCAWGIDVTAIGKLTAAPVGRRLLRCSVCNRTEEKTVTELLGYCQSTWPRCCGEVMAYFT